MFVWEFSRNVITLPTLCLAISCALTSNSLQPSCVSPWHMSPREEEECSFKSDSHTQAKCKCTSKSIWNVLLVKMDKLAPDSYYSKYICVSSPLSSSNFNHCAVTMAMKVTYTVTMITNTAAKGKANVTAFKNGLLLLLFCSRLDKREQSFRWCAPKPLWISRTLCSTEVRCC